MGHVRLHTLLFVTMYGLLLLQWSQAYEIPEEDFHDLDDTSLDEFERREDNDEDDLERRQDGGFDFLNYFLTGNRNQQQVTSTSSNNNLGQQQLNSQPNDQYQQQRTQQYQPLQQFQQQPVQQYRQQQPIQQFQQQQQQPVQQYVQQQLVQPVALTSGRTDTERNQNFVQQQQLPDAANRNGAYDGLVGGVPGGIITIGGQRPVLGIGNFVSAIPKIMNVLSGGGKVMMGVELGKNFYFGPVGVKPLYK